LLRIKKQALEDAEATVKKNKRMNIVGRGDSVSDYGVDGAAQVFNRTTFRIIFVISTYSSKPSMDRNIPI
jgi:hypothetical protein